MATKSKRISKADEIVAYRPKPTLSIDAKDLPGIKSWKIGETYELVVKAKVTSLSAGDEYDDYSDESGKTTRARLTIKDISEK